MVHALSNPFILKLNGCCAVVENTDLYDDWRTDNSLLHRFEGAVECLVLGSGGLRERLECALNQIVTIDETDLPVHVREDYIKLWDITTAIELPSHLIGKVGSIEWTLNTLHWTKKKLAAEIILKIHNEIVAGHDLSELSQETW